MMDDVIKDIANTIRSAVDKGLEVLEPRLKALEERKSVTVEDVQPMLDEMVSKAVGAIEAPKSVTVEDVQPMLDEMVSKAVGAIEPPKSVTVEDVQPMLDEMVSKAVGAIEAPKSVTVEDVQPMLDEMVSKAIERALPDAVNKAQEMLSERLEKALQMIPAPKDGKDALELEVLPEIKVDKSYARGTYATHDGGLWRSYEKTHGMRGWECIVNGVKSHSVEYDGQRKAVIKSTMTDGTETCQELNIPAVLGKGVWREGDYEIGDMVQLSGSSWLCVEDTTERPSIDCKAWLLAAKKGGTGDSAYDTARKAGFRGDKEAWLASLGQKTVAKVK